MSLPSMMFYPGDYLRDTGHLSTEEHGGYLLLLWHAWTQGGVLPTDDEMLRRITRMAPKAWARSRLVVMAFFTRKADGYHQKRMDKEIERARAMVAKKRQAVERTQEWRASNPRQKPDGRGPPDDPPVMHNERITDAQQERNRTHNVMRLPQSQPVPTNQREVKKLINKNPLPSKDLVGSRARENEPDGIEALHQIERRDDEKLSDNPAIEAHIRRTAKACQMHTDDYGQVRSRSQQIEAILSPPEVVGEGEIIPPPCRLGPVDPVRTPEEQIAMLTAMMAERVPA